MKDGYNTGAYQRRVEALRAIVDESNTFNNPETQTGELEVTGNHQNFPLEADSFGFRYFDDEEEQSKEYLKEYKQIGRWFSQMALEERPKVLKQWREMAVEADFEWLHDNFSSKLFKDDCIENWETPDNGDKA
jgi:hypothetical protein